MSDILDPFGNPVKSLDQTTGSLTAAGPQFDPFQLMADSSLSGYLQQQVKNQQNAQLIELLRNLHDGMVVFAAYAQHNTLTEDEERMYTNLVEMARATVKALGYERVVETADIMAMEVPEGNKA